MVVLLQTWSCFSCTIMKMASSDFDDITLDWEKCFLSCMAFFEYSTSSGHWWETITPRHLSPEHNTSNSYIIIVKLHSLCNLLKTGSLLLCSADFYVCSRRIITSKSVKRSVTPRKRSGRQVGDDLPHRGHDGSSTETGRGEVAEPGFGAAAAKEYNYSIMTGQLLVHTAAISGRDEGQRVKEVGRCVWLFASKQTCALTRLCEATRVCMCVCVCKSEFVFEIMTGCHHTGMWCRSSDINPLPVLPLAWQTGLTAFSILTAHVGR